MNIPCRLGSCQHNFGERSYTVPRPTVSYLCRYSIWRGALYLAKQQMQSDAGFAVAYPKQRVGNETFLCYAPS
jgi:hypothetical protein